MLRLLFCYLFIIIGTISSVGSTNHPSYLFFLHNKFIEEYGLDDVHPEHGKTEYHAILDAFRKEGFIVISEKRPSKTDMRVYARKVVAQIDSLLKLGVDPSHITVVGTSKGGYIAQYVSTYLANPDVNYIFIGAFQESDVTDYPDINFCGNILTIYEKSDFYGVSAIRRKETSKLKVSRFKEIELNTGLGHGFLYRPIAEWIRPTVNWGKRNY